MANVMLPVGTVQLTMESTLSDPVVSHQQCDIPLFLSIDGGGTKTKVSIVGRKSNQGDDFEFVILATGTSESSNHTSVGVESAILSIGRATVRALRSLPNRHDLNQARGWNFEGLESTHGFTIQQAPFRKIWAGLSGVDSQSDVELMTIHLKTLFGFPIIESEPNSFETRLRVTNDGELLSAAIQIHYRSNRLSTIKPCRGGLVLIAGTGSIAVAFGPPKNPFENRRTDSDDDLIPLGRLGGYGYLLGDEGSAYYVGQQTIKEILKFNDMRDRLEELEENHSSDSVISLQIQNQNMIKKSRLIELILNHFNVNNLNDLLSKIYSNKIEQERKIKMAEISRLVMKCGFRSTTFHEKIHDDHDEFSMMILTRSAESLSELVGDLCRIYDLNPSEMVLCLGGGMWTFPQFQQLVLRIMNEKWGASWGWIEYIDQPDQVAALSLP